MVQLQTVNELSLLATLDGSGTVYSKAGAMIGYYGQCHFEKVLLGPGGNPMGALMGQISRRITGENIPLMKVASRGRAQVFFANESRHVTVISLRAGESFMVESEDLLAFTDTVKYGLKMLGVGVISQKGLFTSQLTGQGSGGYVAITTDGNPLVLDTPCCVDPDAMVGFTGPDPTFKMDLSWKNLIGQASGESYVLEYRQPGYKVILQPNERRSGLDIGLDNHGESQHVQRNPTVSTAMGAVGGAVVGGMQGASQNMNGGYNNGYNNNNGGVVNGGNGYNNNNGLGGIIGGLLGGNGNNNGMF